MNVVVVGGAGAMGGVWVSRLHAAGNPVAILDVSALALAAIKRDGLVVERKDGSVETVRVPVAADPADLDQPDVVLFLTKSYHTRAAAALAAPLVGSETTVVSLQNGWGNADALAERFPPARIVMGVTYHSALVRAPGRVAYTNDIGPTFLGPYADGASIDRAERFAAAVHAGDEITVTADVKTEVWKKLVLNCATLPTAALTHLTSGDLDQPPPMRDLIDELAREAVAVGRAAGRPVDPEERIAAIHAVLGRAGKGKASMLQDVEAQRPTEVDAINGAVLREADRLGIRVPNNRAMFGLIKGLERSWQGD